MNCYCIYFPSPNSLPLERARAPASFSTFDVGWLIPESDHGRHSNRRVRCPTNIRHCSMPGRPLSASTATRSPVSSTFLSGMTSSRILNTAFLKGWVVLMCYKPSKIIGISSRDVTSMTISAMSVCPICICGDLTFLMG